ncbi:hypothetical protein KP509_03G015100 [Ceratopteris richardii]|uniref:Vacuolar ATPase assembly integral membrane protein VMA21 homolog n=1 Tax=Ceratopteris richardii TaxID=49495 RepID=A0A8T2V978_CERRI|nr:hypothetical protein KP509_03G015100 [Ceratopteris richardii]KAH7440879.1 hypothetical protein KP509_03G015100 [Ceratopteris richardii]
MEKYMAMETAQVIKRFVITSIAMWGFPLFILHLFNNHVKSGLSPRWHTVCSGFLAVLSVNVAIGVYIIMAMRDPSTVTEPQPDPVFVSKAKESLFCSSPEGLETSKKDQ